MKIFDVRNLLSYNKFVVFLKQVKKVLSLHIKKPHSYKGIRMGLITISARLILHRSLLNSTDVFSSMNKPYRVDLICYMQSIPTLFLEGLCWLAVRQISWLTKNSFVSSFPFPCGNSGFSRDSSRLQWRDRTGF